MSGPDAAAILGHAFDAAPAGAIQLQVTLALLANSIGLGMLFALLTFATFAAQAVGSYEERARALQGASNLLFLCVGLTGTMVIINNNMVRAFAIGAAIALVRFRIKLDGKSANASLLFSILAGIACGLGEVKFAWTLLATYALLIGALALVARRLLGQRPGPSPTAPKVGGPLSERPTLLPDADGLPARFMPAAAPSTASILGDACTSVTTATTVTSRNRGRSGLGQLLTRG